jgi:hypothetical protein
VQYPRHPYRPQQNENGNGISLKEELDGIQETEAEMEAVTEHVHALQKILESAKKPVCVNLPCIDEMLSVAPVSLRNLCLLMRDSTRSTTTLTWM